eukprot:gnl/Trimastix_PCT/4780.p1 GENE.gnl/Trimastix_PCT/4780~~gnl/Trimastix_PCT/4780.p1  ORF type:complete len:229 (-),score=22.57 gnl/Trimastix_PCT/4780:56-709(-)
MPRLRERGPNKDKAHVPFFESICWHHVKFHPEVMNHLANLSGYKEDGFDHRTGRQRFSAYLAKLKHRLRTRKVTPPTNLFPEWLAGNYRPSLTMLPHSIAECVQMIYDRSPIALKHEIKNEELPSIPNPFESEAFIPQQVPTTPSPVAPVSAASSSFDSLDWVTTPSPDEDMADSFGTGPLSGSDNFDPSGFYEIPAGGAFMEEEPMWLRGVSRADF